MRNESYQCLLKLRLYIFEKVISNKTLLSIYQKHIFSPLTLFIATFFYQINEKVYCSRILMAEE